MAVTVDNTGNSGVQTGPNASISFNNIAGDAIAVGVAARDGDLADRTVDSITYNGVALTNIRADDDGSLRRTEIWRLLNPPTGTYTLEVIMNAANSPAGGWGFGVVSMVSVHQTTPVDKENGASGTGTGARVSMINVATTSLAVTIVLTEQGDPADVTEAGVSVMRWEIDHGARVSHGNTIVGPNTNDFYGATTAGSNAFVVSAVAFAEAVSGATHPSWNWGGGGW